MYVGKTCHFPTFLAKLAKNYKRLNFQHESKNVSSSVYQHALKPNYLFQAFWYVLWSFGEKKYHNFNRKYFFMIKTPRLY
jgi:hypothetical protein